MLVISVNHALCVALGVILAIALHELIHLVVTLILRIRIEAFFISILALGFALCEEDICYSRVRIALTSLCPLVLNVTLLFPSLILQVIGLVNALSSTGDIYVALKLITMRSLDERIKWSRKIKKDVLRKAIYVKWLQPCM